MRIKKMLLLPLVYLSSSFLAASGGYVVIALLVQWALCLPIGEFLVHGGAFASAFGMPPYHLDYPFQYIAVVAFTYAVVATVWTLCRWKPSHGCLRVLEIVAVMIAALALAMPLGGLLFSWHDMQAGFIPTFWQKKLQHDVDRCFFFAPRILILSFPLTFPGLVVGTLVTDVIDKWYRARGREVTEQNRREV